MFRPTLASLFLLAGTPNCPDLFSLAAHGFTVPTVDASQATGAPDPGGVRLTIDFTTMNPNTFPIGVSSVDYRVQVMGQDAFAGTQSGVSVPEHAQKKIELSGVIPLSSPILRGLTPGQRVTYTATGTAHVDSPAGVPIDVEFNSGGSFIVPASLP